MPTVKLTVRMLIACAWLALWPHGGAADPAEDGVETTKLDPDYVAGKQAIDTKDWSAAIKSLKSAALRDTRNANIHNYLGYAYRNTGQLDLAFKHYKRALELNSRHRGAHEYIGEAYLIKGDLKSAQKHLAALRDICLLPCEELSDLEREIANYVKKSASGRSR